MNDNQIENEIQAKGLTAPRVKSADYWFDEKTSQVSIGSLDAFGISLNSRYGKSHELIELLDFASLVAAKNLHPFVKSVFYDSKGCVATFELDPNVLAGSVVEYDLLFLAKMTIGQFEWIDGCNYHKESVGDAEKEDASSFLCDTKPTLSIQN